MHLRPLLPCIALLLIPSLTHAQQPAANSSTTEQRFFARVAEDSTGSGTQKGATAGSPTGIEYSETAPDGGILIGLELWKGNYQGRMLVVGGVRPIYLTPKGRVTGKMRGRALGASTKIEAKDGFAVAGLDVKGGDRIDQLRIVFMKINHLSARLDSAGSYKSDWYGGKGGQKEKHLYPNQKLVVGIHGGSGDELDRLGLLFLDSK